MSVTTDITRRGQQSAMRYLELFGYEVLESNWLCPAGEIDIIARDGDAVVFIEVKAQSDLSKGLPPEAADDDKRCKLEKIAAWFLRDYEFIDIPVRFDVLSLLVLSEDRALMRHYKNAFIS